MGLERTAAILQDVRSVYETDGYQAIMDWVAQESGVAFGESEVATKAHRVLADHGRGMTFLVGDGVTPSNEGRGYVLRRIIRRAVQQARTIGLDDLWRLSDVVVDQTGEWYPELPENRERIRDVLRAEEERFTETLSRGMKLFEEVAAQGAISGKDAFDLTTTYGFPFELISELAVERGLPVDEDDFNQRMAEHREISRSGGRRAVAALPGPPSEFVGYDQTEVLTAILALNELGDGEFEAKLERSPFYPAGGGQVTDAGWIEHEGTGARAELREAIRIGDDQVLVFEGEGFAAGDRVKAVVPWAVRFPTMTNHTATHLLHEALRRVLGDHVKQAGSAVRPDKLRFDFTQERAMSEEERTEVERLVNEQIFVNRPVRTFETPIDEARRLGAQMLFGEKYGDVVRVVEIDGFSRELCGGTHVRATAEIGPFVILSESSVGSGARRIEAVTSGEAYALLHERAREADELRGGACGRAQGIEARACEDGSRGGRLHDHAGDTGRRRQRARGRRAQRRSARRLRPAEGAARTGGGDRRHARRRRRAARDQPRQVARGPRAARRRDDPRGCGDDRRRWRRSSDDGPRRRQEPRSPTRGGRPRRAERPRRTRVDEGHGSGLRLRADRRGRLGRDRDACAARGRRRTGGE